MHETSWDRLPLHIWLHKIPKYHAHHVISWDKLAVLFTKSFLLLRDKLMLFDEDLQLAKGRGDNYMSSPNWMGTCAKKGCLNCDIICSAKVACPQLQVVPFSSSLLMYNHTLYHNHSLKPSLYYLSSLLNVRYSFSLFKVKETYRRNAVQYCWFYFPSLAL